MLFYKLTRSVVSSGFDASGMLKLFDFGLAKELDPRQRTTNVNYKMSGMSSN